MKSRISLTASALALSALAPAFAEQPDSPALQDVIIVTGRPATTVTDIASIPDAMPDSGPDAASIVARLPGAALIDNGGLSGQVQYRGLFGPRINVKVDGQSFHSGGPNLMDPPLHYAPLPLVSKLVVDRGVSPVRKGPGLAGGVDAVFKAVDFSAGDSFRTSYDLTALARSADESFAVGGVAGASNETFRFHALTSIEKGDDLSFPDGVIASSGHDRLVYGFGAGFRSGQHEFGLSARRQETGDTGNPPFPMDIRYFDTDMASATYKGDFEAFDVDARLDYSTVAHAMTNFHLRTPPPSMMRYRETFADAETLAGELAASFPATNGTWRFGVDGEKADKNVVITNPNNADFFLVTLSDIHTQRLGAYGEWSGEVNSIHAEIGMRIDQHDMDASQADVGSAVPMMPAMLANGFNAGVRDWDATTFDAVARLWKPLTDNMTLRGTLARKSRAPGYLEVFAWLPTPASGGLADGNIYIGNRDLDVETAWVLEGGFDWSNVSAYARPTIFLRQVDDYIQGVPFDDTVGIIDTPVEMVANMNGDATPLIWSNVDARLYGIDLDAGYRFNDHWRVDGTLSYVKAERRDIDDDLYRVSPPNLRAGVTYEQSSWSATLETVMAAEQSDVSVSNSEQETPGYALLNMSAEVQLTDMINVSFGVDNLLNHTWRDHLSGYNRVMGSDVLVGQRLPGSERNAFIRLHISG